MNQLPQSANPVLVTHSRGGVTESFHRGVVCIVNEAGAVVASIGDTSQVCYPRSALKYFQHIPLLVSGAFDHYGFTLSELAIMCGSHNGEAYHVEAARNILRKIGMDESALRCGSQSPTHKSDYLKLIRAGKEPSAIHNNCSGKHSGFLAYCKFMGLSTEDYLSFSHPLHLEIRRITALFHEMEEADIVSGIDGCSAPIFGMPVYNQAVAYKNLISASKFGSDISNACQLLVKAIMVHPEMIAGTKRYCSDLIRVTKGRIIGKTGADGVYSIAIPELKIGICIKLDDGRMGPQYNVAQAILEALNLLSADEKIQLRGYLETDIKNWAGNLTGRTTVSEIVRNVKLS